jgi:hypothetical protein
MANSIGKHPDLQSLPDSSNKRQIIIRYQGVAVMKLAA